MVLVSGRVVSMFRLSGGAGVVHGQVGSGHVVITGKGNGGLVVELEAWRVRLEKANCTGACLS